MPIVCLTGRQLPNSSLMRLRLINYDTTLFLLMFRLWSLDTYYNYTYVYSNMYSFRFKSLKVTRKRHVYVIVPSILYENIKRGSLWFISFTASISFSCSYVHLLVNIAFVSSCCVVVVVQSRLRNQGQWNWNNFLWKSFRLTCLVHFSKHDIKY